MFSPKSDWVAFCIPLKPQPRHFLFWKLTNKLLVWLHSGVPALWSVKVLTHSRDQVPFFSLANPENQRTLWTCYKQSFSYHHLEVNPSNKKNPQSFMLPKNSKKMKTPMQANLRTADRAGDSFHKR